mmetsp:Transcript_38791/g.78248  ORF Transcript_38791/g.78248 Transcript_38791/m.78248 type:complete len:175 (+) Transcript_38791:1-525(+)
MRSHNNSEHDRKTILELESACGVVAMYLKQRGASPVVLTDVYRALPLLKRNVTANRLDCEVCALPWGTPVERLAPAIRSRAPFDLVVASDCSYDFISPEKPSPSLDALLASIRFGARALVCVSRRPKEVEAFEAALQRAGLEPSIVHTAAMDEAIEAVPECLVFSFDFSDRTSP